MRVFGRLVLTALLVAGCGVADPRVPPPAPPRATPRPTPALSAAELGRAVDRTTAAETVTIRAGLEFEGSSAIPDGHGIGVSGQVSYGDVIQATLKMDMRHLRMGTLHVILSDRDAYVRGAIFRSLVDRGTWLHLDLDSEHPVAREMAAALGGRNDPSPALFYLHGVAGPVRYLGEQPVRAVPTHRFGFTIDLEKAIEGLPARDAKLLQPTLDEMRAAKVGSTIPGEAWIDANGVVRRLRFVCKVGEAEGGGEMTGTYEYSGFGAPLEIEIPDAKDVVPFEDVVPALPDD